MRIMTTTHAVISSSSGLISLSSQPMNISSRNMNKSNLTFDNATSASRFFNSSSLCVLSDSSMDCAMRGTSNRHPIYNNNSNSFKKLLPVMWNNSNINGTKVSGVLLSNSHMQYSHVPSTMLGGSGAGSSFLMKMPQDISSCPYDENSGSLPSALPAVQRSSVAPIFYSCYKMSLCNFYKKGRCRNGQMCRFAHGISELRGPPPKKQPGKKKKKKKDFRGDEFNDNSNTKEKKDDIFGFLECILKKGAFFGKKARNDGGGENEESTLDDINSLSAESIKEIVVSLQNLLISKNKTLLKNEVSSCAEKGNREFNVCGSSKTHDENSVNNIISDFVNNNNNKDVQISLDNYLAATAGNEAVLNNNNLFNGNLNKISQGLLSSINDNILKSLSLSDTEASNNGKERRKSYLNIKDLPSHSLSSTSSLVDEPSPSLNTTKTVSTNNFMMSSQLSSLGTPKHLQTSTLAAFTNAQKQHICPNTFVGGEDGAGGDVKLLSFPKMNSNAMASSDKEMRTTCSNETFFLESLKAMTNQNNNENENINNNNPLLLNINHALLLNNSLSSQSEFSLSNEIEAFDTSSSSPFNWASSSSLFSSTNLNKAGCGVVSSSRTRSPIITLDNNTFGLSSVSSPSSPLSSPHSMCTNEIQQINKMPFGNYSMLDPLLYMSDAPLASSLSYSSSSLLQNSSLLFSLYHLFINRLKEKNDATFRKSSQQQFGNDGYDDFSVTSSVSKYEDEQNLAKNIEEVEDLLLKRWRDSESLNSFFSNERVNTNELNDIENNMPHNLSNFLSHISPTTSSSSNAHVGEQKFKHGDIDNSWLPMKYSMFNSFGEQEAVEEPAMQKETIKNLDWFYSNKNDRESNNFHYGNINMMNNVL